MEERRSDEQCISLKVECFALLSKTYIAKESERIKRELEEYVQITDQSGSMM